MNHNPREINMWRFAKNVCAIGALALAVESASGFSLIGPTGADAWQVPDNGFFVPGRGDIGAPKNLGEEYRHNMAVLYYTFDANFLDYFGAQGAAEVEKAFSVYNSLTNVDSYSVDLSEFPLQTLRENEQALALGMLDVKSMIMTLVAENLGLADPVRYVWNVHDRFDPNSNCPFDMEYLIVMRNYDPVIGFSLSQYKVSPYVNEVLYDYYIHDYCSAPHPGDALSEAREFTVDPDADSRLPVATTFGLFASAANSGSIGLHVGGFFTGLTRDDVGGLRYLMSANNMNTESTGPGTTALLTNTSNPQLLFTSNLTQLAQLALTNNAATLQALYPGLTISASSNYFGVLATTNYISYITNFPWDPLGTFHLVITSNVTYSPMTFFSHTFDNVFTISNTGSGFIPVQLTTIPKPNGHTIVTLQTISVTNGTSPWTPIGTINSNAVALVTNVTRHTFATNTVAGDFFILPTNTCGVSFIQPLLTNVTVVTNVLISSTNSTFLTNSINATNIANLIGQSFEQDLIQYFTNRVFVVLPIDCVTNRVALYQGIERITFIRKDFDSLLTRFFSPVTNEYVLNEVTNNTIIPDRIQRVATTPDYLITAQDLSPGPAVIPDGTAITRTNNYNSANAYPGLSGPGTIEPPFAFTFNKASPVFANFAGLSFTVVTTNAFLENDNQIPWVVWGSFDGTTNPPTVYPNDLSIDQLENQVFIQVSPRYLPDGTEGQPYSVTITTQSQNTNTWTSPFTWTMAQNSPGLPPGLGLTSTNDTAIISGTPVGGSAGFYDFMLQITDGQGRTTERSFSIRVNP